MEQQERHDTAAPSADLKYFEKRLLDERKRAVAQMEEFGEEFRDGQAAADGELTSWRFHMADEGTDTFDQEQKYLLASREGRLLWNIDQALRRLYRSPATFDRCADCGGAIGFDRLDAIPYAQHCVKCKHAWEGGRAD